MLAQLKKKLTLVWIFIRSLCTIQTMQIENYNLTSCNDMSNVAKPNLCLVGMNLLGRSEEVVQDRITKNDCIC